MTSFLVPKRLSLLIVLAGTVLLAGCSRPVGSVSGKVSYLTKPLKGGSVTFISTEGRPSASTTINEDGTYTVSNLQAGSYKICVDTSLLKPSADAGGYPAGAKGDKGVKGAPPPDAVLPEGYKPSNPAEAQAAARAPRNRRQRRR